MQAIRYCIWTNMLTKDDVFTRILSSIKKPVGILLLLCFGSVDQYEYRQACSRFRLLNRGIVENPLKEEEMEKENFEQCIERKALEGGFLFQMIMFMKTSHLSWIEMMSLQKFKWAPHMELAFETLNQYKQRVRKAIYAITIIMKPSIPKDVRKLICMWIWTTRFDDKWYRRRSKRVKL
jgi:hypothetical protein